MTILIKIPRGKVDLTNIKQVIQSEIDVLLREKKYRDVRVIADVDPV